MAYGKYRFGFKKIHFCATCEPVVSSGSELAICMCQFWGWFWPVCDI